MNKLVLLAASVAMISLPAVAADVTVYEAAPVAAVSPAGFDWSGAYLGAHLGYGWGKTEDINNDKAVAKDLDGVLGGIQAGYNVQLPSNVVLGAEASLSFANVHEEWFGADTDTNNGYYTDDKVEAVGALKARLGYAMDNFLPYITGGLAIARTSHMLGCTRDRVQNPKSRTCTHLDGGDRVTKEFETSKSGTSVGWTIGAGAEYALDQNWSLRGEYLYTDIGSKTVTLFDPNYPDLADRKFDTHFHTVTFGINYRF